MNIAEAEKIVKAYGATLSKGGTARPKSSLPCSTGRIKYAYFVYIEALIRQGLLTDEVHGMLFTTYIGLGSFVEDEEAKKIEPALRTLDSAGEVQEVLMKNPHGSVSEFLQSMTTQTSILESEFGDFVKECKQQYH